MDFIEARRYILKRLQEELPPNLYYHGIHHTVDVCNAVDQIAKNENVNGENLSLLQTAALYHDIGFINTYLNNEPVAVQIAQDTLKQFNYSQGQIDIISSIIMATSIPQNPKNHIEEIMCDADLDYLGRDDFYVISETLKKEWMAYGLISSDEEWNQKQVNFFDRHQYFTQSSRKNREPKKQQHLAELKKLLK